MTQTEAVQKLHRAHRRSIERLLKRAYGEGYEAGMTRAHGQGRRGRTIRADATVDGLVRIIERHFGLDGYGFQVRVVHAESGRRVPSHDLIGKYRIEP